MTNKILNLIILGPQGSGKGTQANLLAEKFDLAHIDVGFALRKAAEADTPYGRLLNEIINVKKELVSDDLVSIVLDNELKEIVPRQGIILDGAPRRLGQTELIEKVLRDYQREISKVIYINISEKESVIRISKRYNCGACKEGLIMGKDFRDVGDACHMCGGKIEQRHDDTPEGVRKRLEIFREETIPVIGHYQKKNKLIEVNGEQNANRVFEKIITELREK